MDGFRIVEVDPATPGALERIGRLRVAVWGAEGSLSKDLASRGVWLDRWDATARHWLVIREADETLVACGRVTFHETLAESPDGYVWLDAGRRLPEPVANVSKLVVRADARRRGIATRMVAVRVEAAIAAGARALTVTASLANVRPFLACGFVDSDLAVEFPDRPGVTFKALERVL